MTVLDTKLASPFTKDAGIVIRYKEQDGTYFVFTDVPDNVVGMGTDLQTAAEDFRKRYNQYLDKQGNPYRLYYG